MGVVPYVIDFSVLFFSQCGARLLEVTAKGEEISKGWLLHPFQFI